MNVNDLRNFYNVKNNSRLSKRLNCTRSNITYWEKHGIPSGVQAILEIQTNGVLKADLKQKID